MKQARQDVRTTTFRQKINTFDVNTTLLETNNKQNEQTKDRRTTFWQNANT